MINLDHKVILKSITSLRGKIQIKIQKSIMVLFACPAIIITWIYYFYYWIIYMQTNSTGLYMFYSFLLQLGIFPILLLGRFIGNKIWKICSIPVNIFLWKIFRSISNIAKSISKKIKDTQNIDEILIKLRECEKLMRKMKNLRILFFWNTSLKNSILQCQEEIINWLQRVITDINSDLKIRIIQEAEILKQAKSEVSKNLTGTLELLEVSKTQKLRLDRQIEQFEELQKRLISL